MAPNLREIQKVADAQRHIPADEKTLERVLIPRGAMEGETGDRITPI